MRVSNRIIPRSDLLVGGLQVGRQGKELLRVAVEGLDEAEVLGILLFWKYWFICVYSLYVLCYVQKYCYLYCMCLNEVYLIEILLLGDLREHRHLLLDEHLLLLVEGGDLLVLGDRSLIKLHMCVYIYIYICIERER